MDLAVQEDRKMQKWLEDEIKIIKAEYKRKTDKEIAKLLKRSVASVREKRNKIGLKNKEKKRWTNEEIEILRANHKIYSNKKLAKMCGRSENAVRIKKNELGLQMKKSRSKQPNKFKLNPNPITECTKTIVCSAIIRGESVDNLSKDIGRTPEQIQNILAECKANGKYKFIEDFIKNNVI